MITNRYDSDMVLHYMIYVSVMIASLESMLVYVTISKLNSWQYFLTSTYAYGKCFKKNNKYISAQCVHSEKLYSFKWDILYRIFCIIYQ